MNAGGNVDGAKVYCDSHFLTVLEAVVVATLVVILGVGGFEGFGVEATAPEVVANTSRQYLSLLRIFLTVLLSMGEVILMVQCVPVARASAAARLSWADRSGWAMLMISER